MKQRKKPALRFKGFVNDWEQRKLGDFGAVAMCKRIFKDQTSEKGDIPFYKIGTFGGVPDAYIPRELFNEYKQMYPYPEKGDILISASGSIGRTVEYTGEDAYFQDSNIVWLRHDKSIVNLFLKYLYEVIQWAGIEGSTIKRLYNDNILTTEVMIPSVQEQEKIGAYLDRIDHLITLHQRKLEKLQNLKKSMLEKMFPKNGAKVPEIRFKGFTNDWEQRKLGELAGKTYGGGTPRTSEKTFWNGQVPWFQSSDLIEDKVLSAIPKKKITEKGLQKSAAQLIPENSIAIIMRVGVGKLAFIPFSYSTSQDFLSLSALNIDGKFGCYSIYKLLQREKNLTQGTSIKGITKKELLRKILWIPCQDEQIKIGRYIANIDNLITLHQRKLRKLQNLKKAMLEKMFI
ncbi:restriction endonuclease subunit S [uncultured Megasphaera sp.]|uniref:restriction endonuclease subunit S n=1 Tax=uncultured Megasphaera sp. TaxID=165188 RepID=UPI002600B47E|nr:restriction endonuclease subunit S [uncultured Megasphaera sp.]